jgi:hypothetical protein
MECGNSLASSRITDHVANGERGSLCFEFFKPEDKEQ